MEMFEVTDKLTMEKIRKFDENRGIFYRFQNPRYEIEGEYTQSWGMIYSTAEEAIENAEEDGLDEDEAVLPGKSCFDCFKEVTLYWDQFCNSDVLLVFEGEDTGVEGHDGERVAEYIAPVAVFSMQDVVEFYNEHEEEIREYSYM